MYDYYDKQYEDYGKQYDDYVKQYIDYVTTYGDYGDYVTQQYVDYVTQQYTDYGHYDYAWQYGEDYGELDNDYGPHEYGEYFAFGDRNNPYDTVVSLFDDTGIMQNGSQVGRTKNTNLLHYIACFHLILGLLQLLPAGFESKKDEIYAEAQGKAYTHKITVISYCR